MKNRLIITVSDIAGTKSYNIHQFVKKIGILLIFLAMFLIASSVWLVSTLSDKMDLLKVEKEHELQLLLDKEKELVTLNKVHSLKIQDKIKDIEALSSKIDDIEEIIGIDNNKVESPIQRAKILEITTKDRLHMLQIIPNGLPLLKTSVASNFGYRIHPITKTKKFHRGIDLRAKRNTKVFATANGVVRRVQPRDVGDFGRLVIISHNYGFETIYAHLQKTKVKIGDLVKKGDVIALSGTSGRSTGPHLHYEVRHASRILNPKTFMNWNLKTYETIFAKERRVKWDSLVEMINQRKM